MTKVKELLDGASSTTILNLSKNLTLMIGLSLDTTLTLKNDMPYGSQTINVI